jgi:phenylpropionate dioxygenase-like ring-hydroxylating dioxygenase large terminal subunit
MDQNCHKQTFSIMKYIFKLNFVVLISNSIFVHSFQFSRPRISLFPRHSAAINVESPITISSETEENQKDVDKQFDWFKSWYPLVPVEILDREKPHRFHLLGQDIVVWNDSPIEGNAEFRPKSKRPRGAKRSDTGTWRVFEDECPHRKVPLSEGRIEDDGTLLCSYHAWRFDGQGSCVAVPQLESENELMRIKHNPKSKCNSYPTKVINGILFVWPSSDKDAVLESELTPVVHRPAEVDVKRLWEGPWNFRELPYGADFFIENVVDPGEF